MRLVRVAAIALVASGGCVIHLGGDDDPPCLEVDYVASGLVDPTTLQCQYFGPECDPACGPCPATADIAYPSWGSCDSPCRGLAEWECANTSGCRATYDYACIYLDIVCPLPSPFLGCYPTDATGPVQGACLGLDAWECSRHDDCMASYRPTADCRDGIDQDQDGIVDDPDECPVDFVQCDTEPLFECPPNADCG